MSKLGKRTHLLTITGVFNKAVEQGGQLSVKSALNPMLWLCSIIVPSALVASLFFDEPPWWIIGLALSPVVVTLIGFIFFMFRAPERLQSEEFQVQMRSMEWAQQKGDTAPLELHSPKAIENPDIRTISHHDGGNA